MAKTSILTAEIVRTAGRLKELKRVQAAALGRDWRAGKPIAAILAEHGITRGQLTGIVGRHGWRRPVSPRELSDPQRRLFRKLKRAGFARIEAFHEARRT